MMLRIVYWVKNFKKISKGFQKDTIQSKFENVIVFIFQNEKDDIKSWEKHIFTIFSLSENGNAEQTVVNFHLSI